LKYFLIKKDIVDSIKTVNVGTFNRLG
jgi:hypothetical protein